MLPLLADAARAVEVEARPATNLPAVTVERRVVAADVETDLLDAAASGGLVEFDEDPGRVPMGGKLLVRAVDLVELLELDIGEEGLLSVGTAARGGISGSL